MDLPSRRSTLPAAAALALMAVGPRAAAITPQEMEPHRQTRAEMAAVGGAIIGWITDQINRQGPAPGLGSRIDGAGSVDVSDYPPITHADLEALLVPNYLTTLPAVDGWGNAYDYHLDTLDILGPHVALIRSAGADATFDSTTYSFGDTSSLSEDLVWADGFPVRAAGPPLLDLGDRLRRCLSELVRTHNAMLAWVTDNARRRPLSLAGDVDLSLYPPITAQALATLLVPVYLPWIPDLDPWGGPYDYYLETVDFTAAHLLAVRSRGRDGLAEGTVYTPGTHPAADLDRDIVYADGLVVRAPVGVSDLLLLDGFETGDDRHWSVP